jgi:asparagine synthase (glutamine-hydrolysing)
MCGIAGFIDPTLSGELRSEAVLRMCAAMIHRGPDDWGIALCGPATVGMRRLAIFDPTNGHQPMATPDGRYTLVFNGAIYNFHSLQRELESVGWAFRTRCDTEVLLAALVQWGKGALEKLRGMFAFALWDSAEESLFAARDPFGIKPLYYRHDGKRLLFASETAALLASDFGAIEIDPLSVAEYLAWFAVPAPRTIYKGIMSLRPGECLQFCRGQLKVEEAWTFKGIQSSEAPCTSKQEFVEGLRAHLDDTIRSHVIADVPVGAFLSGGLDSAVIAGLMSQASGNALRTFSIGFEEDDFSEANEAEETARFFGAVHHTRIITGDEVARDVENIISACDQPTGDGVNTYYASQTAQAGGVKVALSGLGGDEIFGGYPSFRDIPMLAAKLPLWRRLPGPLRSLALITLKGGGVRAQKLSDFLSNAREPHELAALQRRVFSNSRMRALLSQSVLSRIEGSSPFHPALVSMRADVDTGDLFSLVSAWEMRTYMADVLLRDSDVMSMRHSLELRVPFIDRPLVEWLWRQPSQFRNDPKNPKSALVDATLDILPPALLKRRKRGFTLPFAIWMRRDLKPFLDETFSSSSIGKSGLFAIEPVQALWANFASGGEDRDWSRVWSIAVLIAFVNRAHGGGSGFESSYQI